MCEAIEINSPLDQLLATGKVSPKEWADKKREEIAKEVRLLAHRQPAKVPASVQDKQ